MRIIKPLFILFFLFLFVQHAFAEQFLGKIKENGINVRSDASTNSQVICKLDNGNNVEVVLEKYGWYKIRLPDLASCFIKKSLVAPLETEVIPALEKGSNPQVKIKTIKAQGDNLNVRLGAGEKFLIIGRVSQNEVLNVVDDQGAWYRINCLKNSFGWVHSKFIEKISDIKELPNSPIIIPGPQAQSIIETQSQPKPIAQFQPIAQPQSQPQPSVSINRQFIEVTGIVQTYGKVFNRIATHKLIGKDRKTYLLRGNKQNLNDLVNHTVRVSGKISIPEKQKFPLIEIDKLEALD